MNITARKLNGLWRRFIVLLLGRPTYNTYFKFLQQDHKLPPDPRALRRAGLKGGFVGFMFFLFATICMQIWFIVQIGPIVAAGPNILPDLWGSPIIPFSCTAWTFQLLFHAYPTPQISAMVGHTVEMAWVVEMAFVIPSSFAFGMFVMTSNSRDRVGLSMEHGSARYALPEEIMEIMPRNYDIWEGFTDVEEARRKLDQQRYAEREARIAEFSKAYLDWERQRAGGDSADGVPSLPEDFSPLQHPEFIEDTQDAIGVDPSLLEPLDADDVTSESEPQFVPGVPKYEIDPALRDEPPPALSA